MFLKAPFRMVLERGRRVRRRFARFRDDARGATAVEFAMIAIPFFMIFCAIFESAFLVFNQGNLEAATYSASRQLLTGTGQGAGWTVSDFRNQLCNSSGLWANFDCQNTSKMKIDVRSASDFTSDPTAGQGMFSGATTMTYTPGSSGNVVVVRVGYLYPLFFTGLTQFGSIGGMGTSTANIMATAVFKTE